MRMIIAAALALTLLSAPGAQTADAEGDAMEASLANAFAAGDLKGLHSVLVLRHGEVFAEAYFEGKDERWGAPSGSRHGPETLHDIRSISKSVTAILYGIALDRGLAPGLDESLIAQFPEYPDLAADPEWRRITVRDALTMRMGIEWDEDKPYTSAENSEIAMELADDRYRFVLSRPVTGPPGGDWTYNGGATALIAALIERGTGLPLADFAREALFAPLGIDSFEWIEGSDGRAAAASGLRLTTRGLAAIGRLVAEGGVHNGEALVPAAWVAEMTRPHGADLPFGLRYGYFWWLAPKGVAAKGEAPDDDRPFWVAGFGNGGQRLWIAPRHGLVAVVFAGRYNDMEAWRLPVAVISDHLAPAVGLK